MKKKSHGEDNRRDHQEVENKRYWKRQIRDRERIMQLEEKMGKSKRKNAELPERMMEKERWGENRKRRVAESEDEELKWEGNTEEGRVEKKRAKVRERYEEDTGRDRRGATRGVEDKQTSGMDAHQPKEETESIKEELKKLSQMVQAVQK